MRKKSKLDPRITLVLLTNNAGNISFISQKNGFAPKSRIHLIFQESDGTKSDDSIQPSLTMIAEVKFIFDLANQNDR